jgi:uroporphyrin-3 C-methyltransferase
MSDKDIDQAAAEAVDEKSPPRDDAPIEEASSGQPEEQEKLEKTSSDSGSSVAWLAFLVAIVALAAAGYTAWQNWRSTVDTTTDDRLTRLESELSSSERSLAELLEQVNSLGQRDPGFDAEINALRRAVDERIRQLESLPSRMSTLESSVASLAGVSEGARDAWILAESEYYMQIANAQLQLANNPHLATLALRMADERLVQLADPRLIDVRRAIADELAALDVMEKPDIEGATLTLASLARVVESLPLAGMADEPADEAGVDAEQSGVGRAWASVKNAMSGLVKVTPVEQARITQLSPDAEHFLRSNIALQLQAARLALLRGEQTIFRQTLDDTSVLLTVRRLWAHWIRSRKFAARYSRPKSRTSPSRCACSASFAR